MVSRRGIRQRGQGMTEYVILVGLCALLLIGAVNRYGFALYEAIAGSSAAIEAYVTNPPPEGESDGFVSDVRYNSTKDGRTHTIYLVKQGAKWLKKVDSPTLSAEDYSQERHGPLRGNSGQ